MLQCILIQYDYCCYTPVWMQKIKLNKTIEEVCSLAEVKLLHQIQDQTKVDKVGRTKIFNVIAENYYPRIKILGRQKFS